MEQGKLTGLSIALVKEDSIVWSEGFGLADKKKNIKATAQTRYRAGSISKLFNVIAIMQLVEQGKLDLDAPVVRYVPDFHINSRFGSTDDITLRSLLSHQSGMPSDSISGMWQDNPPPLNSLIDTWENSFTVAPANTFFNYSNTGISLSGLAVQRIAGVPYEQHLQRAVLDVIGMTNSDFSSVLRGDTAASAYLGKKQIEEKPLRDIPAGGLNTTVEDLGKFLIAIHEDGRVAPEKLGGRFDMLGHDGRTIAHSAKLVTAPKAQISVVVLSNSADNSDRTTTIAKEAMKMLYATMDIPELAQEQVSPVVAKLETTADLAGDYAGPFDLIQIKPDGKNFSANAFGMTVSLRPALNNLYSVRVKLSGLTVQPNALKSLRITSASIDGIDRLIAIDNGKPTLLGDKITPYPSTPLWDKILGEYQARDSAESEIIGIKSAQIKRDKNYYYVEVTDTKDQKTKSAIQPINDNQFIILGTGRSLGETVTVNYEADQPFISYSGLEFFLVANNP